MRLVFVTALFFLVHSLAGFSASEVEPNNTPESANVLLSGEVIEFELSSADDYDFFSIEIASSGHLAITASLISDDPLVDPALFELLSPSLQVIAIGGFRANSDENASEQKIGIGEAGQYFVRVFDPNYPDLPATSGVYRFSAKLESSQDGLEVEPNDSPETANAIDLGAENQIVGNLFLACTEIWSDCYKDIDFFKLSLEAVDASNFLDFITPQIERVLDASMQELPLKQGRLLHPEPGDYYLQIGVGGFVNDWPTGGGYGIMIELGDKCSTYVDLKMQADIDTFKTDYGPCDQYTGAFSVGNAHPAQGEISDIDNLRGISGIGSFSGLNVNHAPLLTDLSDLAGVTSIAYLFVNNDGLRSVDGLETLATASQVGIKGANIQTVEALENLQQINSLHIDAPIVSFPVLSRLEQIHSIHITNTLLTNLDELSLINSLPAWNNFAEGYASLRVTGNADLTDCSAIAPLLGWPSIPHSPETDHIADEEQVWGVEYGGSVHIYGNGEGANSPDDCLNAYSIRDEDGDGIVNIDDGYPYISISGFTDTDNDGRPDSCNSNCVGLGMAADLDDDNDGLSDQQELGLGTDPLKRDTDGDGWSDREEIEEGTDPLFGSSQPELPPGLPPWLLYQAASLSTSASSDGINYAAQAFYFDNNVDQLVQGNCVSCHRTGGLAEGDSDLIFTSSASNNHMQFQAYVNTPSVGAKADELLSNIDGGMGHGGGRVIAADSWQYQLFVDYVDRLKAGP